MSGVRNSCETVATSSDLRRSAALRSAASPLGDARRGDLAHDDDAADQRTRGVAHRPGMPLEDAPEVGELEDVLGLGGRIGGDRLHRGEVALGLLQTGRDRRALRQRRIARESEDVGREFLDDAVRENRAPVEIDQPDAVDARVEERVVQLEHALQRIAMCCELLGLLAQQMVLLLQSRRAPAGPPLACDDAGARRGAGGQPAGRGVDRARRPGTRHQPDEPDVRAVLAVAAVLERDRVAAACEPRERRQHRRMVVGVDEVGEPVAQHGIVFLTRGSPRSRSLTRVSTPSRAISHDIPWGRANEYCASSPRSGMAPRP